jgi:ubiquinone/menaquinone biosynthesis C-methylase UbiE
MSAQTMPINPAETYQSYFVPAKFAPCAQILLGQAKPQPGEQVLDVACGTGVVARMAAPLVGPTGRVVGLDVNAAMLSVARHQSTGIQPPIEWREESALAMTLPDASFDLVLCQQGLQFFPDQPVGAREMRRVLKPDGRAVAACWRGLDSAPVVNTLLHAQARHLNIPIAPLAKPHSMVDANMLRALFADAGFQQVEVTAHNVPTRFPQPERFVQLHIESTAAAVPVMQQMDAATRAKMAEDVARELHDELSQYVEGEYLVSPMSTWIVVAR